MLAGLSLYAFAASAARGRPAPGRYITRLGCTVRWNPWKLSLLLCQRYVPELQEGSVL